MGDDGDSKIFAWICVGASGGLILLIFGCIQYSDVAMYNSWTSGTCDFTWANQTEDTTHISDFYPYVTVDTMATVMQHGQPHYYEVLITYPPGNIVVNAVKDSDCTGWLAGVAQQKNRDCFINLGASQPPYPAVTQNITGGKAWIAAIFFGVLLTVVCCPMFWCCYGKCMFCGGKPGDTCLDDCDWNCNNCDCDCNCSCCCCSFGNKRTASSGTATV